MEHRNRRAHETVDRGKAVSMAEASMPPGSSCSSPLPPPLPPPPTNLRQQLHRLLLAAWHLFFSFCCIRTSTARTRTVVAPGHRERRSAAAKASSSMPRLVLALCFLSMYFAAHHQLEGMEEHEMQLHYIKQQQQEQRRTKYDIIGSKTGLLGSSMEKNVTAQSPSSRSLSHYLTRRTLEKGSDANSSLTLEEARKGREPILAILEDAGIQTYDASDVVQLPLWSSVVELYYSRHGGRKRDNSISDRTVLEARESTEPEAGGPVILGLEGCAAFRERVPAKDRFLGVAGSFNSGTTAFGVSLQKNCRLAEHGAGRNWQESLGRGKRRMVVSNANGMLSQVPWAKHKMASYRFNHTLLPPSSTNRRPPIDHNHVLPIVLVRDPFYWMQSMCKEGYGVRWDHDSNHHCPNLVPNDFDRARFSAGRPQQHGANATTSSVPVWMGPNPTVGPSWPSLVHYWNAWYESYYYNDDTNNGYTGGLSKNSYKKGGEPAIVSPQPNQKWPRLIIRFEDTLFYPREVMAKVCHCSGGILNSETAIGMEDSSIGAPLQRNKNYEYSLSEAKPHHHETPDKNTNFVQAMVQYGTNATRFRNMTDDDLRFAIESLNPTLMEAFGYSYGA